MKTARKGRPESYISIRSKLVAAVAMLLVASFMVVSSSYAWFTLSTAPEVKGIQTSIGANGNLEIALSTGNENITSGVGDNDKYETWGNLIDLSKDEYGLSLIKLYPARLNVAEGKIKVGAPLMTPEYAADGRVKSLEENTLTGSYHSDDKQILEYVAENAVDNEDPTNPKTLQKPYGVRGIGNSNGLTPQQLDHRNALVALNAAVVSARENANRSLNEAGSRLATIAADHAANTGEGDYDLTPIADMLQKLDAARAQVDTMILSYIKADVANKNAELNADKYSEAKKPYYAATIENYETTLGGWVTANGNADLAEVWTYRNYIKSAIDASQTKYDALEASADRAAGPAIEHATWEETRDILTGLVDLTAVTLNGVPTDQIKENMNTLFSAVTSGDGVIVNITDPGNTNAANGVYVDLAKVCGNVRASINIEQVIYNGATFGPIKATMRTEVNPAPAVSLTDDSFPAEPSGENVDGAATINDLYGYIVDLAFRTNAVDSKLRLRTTPDNRIYSGQNTETMGEGSNMVFKYTSSFGVTSVTSLMQHIRIVFADIASGQIYAVGGLDVTGSKEVEGVQAVYAPIKLYDPLTYTIDSANGLKVKTDENLKNTEIQFLAETDAEIMTLPQNEQVELSVYVYLDGDSVQNKDVPTDLAIEGKLNLQFNSTATLTPMQYSPLMEQTQGGTPEAGGGSEPVAP